MKYPECEDCHFRNMGLNVCDECDDGDQWEPCSVDDDDGEGPYVYEPGTYPIYMLRHA